MWKLALIALVVPWIAFGFTSCHLWHYSCYLLKYHSKLLLTIQPYSFLYVIRISNVDFRVAKYMCFIIVFFLSWHVDLVESDLVRIDLVTLSYPFIWVYFKMCDFYVAVYAVMISIIVILQTVAWNWGLGICMTPSAALFS